eukprot:TRINITY_DN226_c0_g1_i3.p4 TRINITY_DN226_c0_g1~~TRINITY_DN226_c0_g1_i3.p4  ORF type:complete len:53 (+),score=18.73 TRINITY_DN226_c0_g1_i3:363-521(+)
MSTLGGSPNFHSGWLEDVIVLVGVINAAKIIVPHVLCVDTGRSSETAKAHRG